ncbi:hypothetical protein ACQKP3_09920 [Vibrio sp. DNB22_10_4]
MSRSTLLASSLMLCAGVLLSGCDSSNSAGNAPSQPPSTNRCDVDWQQSFTDLNRDWTRSQYDHHCDETAQPAPQFTTSSDASSSVHYANIFDGERERYGYNPRFIPGRPYFDANNLPWMIVNNMNQFNVGDGQPGYHQDPVTLEKTNKPLHALTYDDRVYSSLYSDANPCTDCDSYLVRLTPNGEWISTSLRAMEQEFGFRQNADGLDGYRYRYIEQVYFQDNGDVFFKLDHGAIRYQVQTQTWQGYKKNWLAQTEMVGNGSQPPLFIRTSNNNSEYAISRLIDIGNDELDWQEETLSLPIHLGLYRGSKPVIWEGNTLHIAAISYDESALNRLDYNTGQYYVRYQLGTEQADVLFMGWSGSTSEAAPDGHNQPILLLDSQKRLHFISGAHNHQIWHRYSLEPVTNNDWNNGDNLWGNVTANDKFSYGRETPVGRYPEETSSDNNVNYVGQSMGRYTYVHAVIQSDDSILLAMRNTAPATSAPSGYRLEWIAGTPQTNGQYQWQDKGVIVMPNWQQYSNYTQKLHQDKRGNLYLLYTYEIQNFNDDTWFNQMLRVSKSSQQECELLSDAKDCIHVVSEHYRRWPNEILAGSPNRYSQQFQHHPVLLVSSDKGNTWRLATTEALLSQKTK